MAIKEVLLPHLGESVTEASVVGWLVQPGDKVKRYQPLMEVVSDKVTTEVPSDFEGVIKETFVELDTDYPIGTLLMTIEVEGADEAPAPAAPAVEEKVEASAAPVAAAPVKAAPAKPAGAAAGRFSPAVLKLAGEKGIDLSLVTGTGKEGRITRKDILNFVPGETPVAAPAVEAAPVAETPVAAPKAAAPAPVFASGNDEVVPADGVRKAIAKKMVQSVTEIPHAWIMVEADVTNIVNLRNSVKDDF
jgi:2-oxoisovalerate dehydrogenase E2 component (dihydrolipoyl transacylase)